MRSLCDKHTYVPFRVVQILHCVLLLTYEVRTTEVSKTDDHLTLTPSS
jgi:hypothetical protein